MKRLGWQTALVWLAAGLLRAQFETAEVLGTIRDHTGSVVAKAAVTLLSQDTGIQGKVSTDENGNYDFFNVKGDEFRSEFFNVLNHTNLGLPDPVSTNTAFGTIRTTYSARQIQFALKLML
jgi:Carboxypeptidase regulatory-like domain